MLCRNNIQASLQSQNTAGCTSNAAQAQRNGNHTDLTFAHRNGKPADRRSKCNRDCMVSGKLRHLARRGSVPFLIVNRELAELVNSAHPFYPNVGHSSMNARRGALTAKGSEVLVGCPFLWFSIPQLRKLVRGSGASQFFIGDTMPQLMNRNFRQTCRLEEQMQSGLHGLGQTSS